MSMEFKKARYGLVTVVLLSVALMLAGCGGDDGVSQSVHDQVVTERDKALEDLENQEPEVVEVEVQVPDASGLEGVQEMAANAAMAAKMASDAANMASGEAMAATANLATMQTGAMSGMHAMNAKKYADMVMAEYMKAKMASDAAAAATTTTAATTEKDKAEAAQMAAEKYAMMVANEEMTGYADKAKKYAMMELMIDGTMKSVGETTIDAMVGASSVTTGTGDDAQTVLTGLIESKNPMAMGDEITGVPFEQGAKDNLATAADESTPDTPYKQGAEARTFAIGKTLDSPDDMARLMLITGFAGEVMVKIFNEGTGPAVTGTKAGRLSVANDNDVALRSEGMFYPAGAAASTETAGALTADLKVADDAKPVEVFSYTDPEGGTIYVTLTTTTTTGGVTTYSYTSGADITGETGADGPDEGTELEESQIISGIPGAVDYEHLHFGVWASLGDAEKDGSQEVDELGIGFVQNFSGGGMTADMPITGSATYEGDWAATVETAAGDVSLENGAAQLKANFVKATLTADLDGLAMLEGTLDGNTFSGTKATVGANDHGLTSGGKFTGTFSGGFYGDVAAEAGGIFDFSSTNAGAFIGALGGKKEMP